MAMHVVPADAGHLVELFGGETGDEEDKFERCGWHEGPAGLPILDECGSWFAGRIVERVPLGDHVGRVLEPFDGRAEYDGPAFPLSRAKGIEPGHEA
jgi:flavin reductase (DIM6/NTAB) family NADH-FMN oxidoreductase RutF